MVSTDNFTVKYSNIYLDKSLGINIDKQLRQKHTSMILCDPSLSKTGVRALFMDSFVFSEL
jgi:hypothetical protein